MAPIVCAKVGAGGPTLTWAHNLFMIWALNFLLWVVLYIKTQWNYIPFQIILPFSLLSLS